MAVLWFRRFWLELVRWHLAGMQIGRDWFQRNGNSRRVCPTSARARLPGTFEFRGRPGAFFQISGGVGTKKSISTGTVGGSPWRKGTNLWSLFWPSSQWRWEKWWDVWNGAARVIFRQHLIFWICFPLHSYPRFDQRASLAGKGHCWNLFEIPRIMHTGRKHRVNNSPSDAGPRRRLRWKMKLILWWLSWWCRWWLCLPVSERWWLSTCVYKRSRPKLVIYSPPIPSSRGPRHFTPISNKVSIWIFLTGVNPVGLSACQTHLSGLSPFEGLKWIEYWDGGQEYSGKGELKCPYWEWEFQDKWWAPVCATHTLPA